MHGVQAIPGQRSQCHLREPARLVDVRGRRDDLGLGELADRLAEQFVLVGRGVEGKSLSISAPLRCCGGPGPPT